MGRLGENENTLTDEQLKIEEAIKLKKEKKSNSFGKKIQNFGNKYNLRDYKDIL